MLVVRGYNFTPNPKVTFGGVVATDITVADPQTLTLTTPPGAAAAVDVVVTNSDGAVQTFTKGFTYYVLSPDAGAGPVVTSVAPNSGPSGGGTVALIQGQNFQTGAVVVVGGRPARQQTFVDANDETATLAGGPVGTAKVAVTNPDGRSGLLVGGFAYYDPSTAGTPPQLTNLTPIDGPTAGGQAATASGLNFATTVRAYLGGLPITLTSSTASSLAFATPAGPRGLADFAVTNPDGQSAVLPGVYNYFAPPPQVLGVVPYYGPTAGGTPLVVQGQDFASGATLTLGGVVVSGVTVVSSTEIDATTPSATKAGPADVLVTNADGLSGVLPGGYYYADATHSPPAGGGAVALTRLSPNVGPSTGGISVSAFGGGFQAGASITVGGTAATNVRVLGATTLTFTLPAGAVGPADVVVTNLGGATATLKVAFTYYDPNSTAAAPTLSGVDPSSSPTTGGAKVAITGANFTNGARVFFGVNEATAVGVVNAGQAAANVPAGIPGVVDVLFVNPDGKSDRLTNGFAYFQPVDGGAPAPTLLSLNPASGSTEMATTVAVSGTGFQTGVVAFAGNLLASVTAVTATTLTVTVPPGVAGTVDFTVTNPDGQGAVLPQSFTFNPPPGPTVTSVSPSSGPTDATTPIVITGTGFEPGVVVTVNGVPVATTLVGSTTLDVSVPPQADGGGSVIVITDPDGQSVTVPSGDFTYVVAPPPTISSVTPNTGSTEADTQVAIAGTGFVPGATAAVDGQGVDTTYVNSTEVDATFPAHDAGNATVTVTNPDGQVATAPSNAFRYARPAPPVITQFNPSSAQAGQVVTVTISGTGFVQGTVISVNGTTVPTTYVGPGEVTATFPAQAAGSPIIVVTNPDGQSTTASTGAFSFSAVPPPTLTSVVPNTGLANATIPVTLTGTKFATGALVTVGGVQATSVVVVSGTSITCTFPGEAGGRVDVVVTNPDHQTATISGGFTYTLPPPTVTAISPSLGPTTGNSSVLISGTNFETGAQAFFAGNVAASTVLDPQHIRAVTPSGNPGQVDVTVQNPDGLSATLFKGYQYQSNFVVGPAPVITQLIPATGPSTGGTKALMQGQNFQSGMAVEVGGKAATVTVFSPTQATITTGSNQPGAADVVATNPDGQYGTLLRGFTYVDPTQLGAAPTCTGSTPTSGPSSAPTNVYITGSNFQSGAIFFFRDAIGPNILFVNNSLLQGQAPAQDAGPADVTVTNPDGQSATAPNAFTYNASPLVSGVAPSTGPTSGGTTVVVSGSGFRAGAGVYFGTASSPNVTVQSTTLISAVTPPGPLGPADVKVVDSDGQSSALTAGFTYVAPPTVTSLTPPTGPSTGGTVLVIAGTAFQPGVVVTFGGVAGVVDGSSPTEVVVTAPAGTVGSAPVVVTNPDGQTVTATGGFAYVNPSSLGPAPTLISMDPTQGPATGGTVAALYGTHFAAGAILIVGSSELTDATIVDATTASGTVGAGSIGTLAKAILTNPDGQSAVLGNAFDYLDPASLPPPPVLNNVTPNQGSVFGGDHAIANGQNFDNGSFVLIGGTAQPSSVVGTNGINFVAQPGSLGTFSVTVTTFEGQSVTVPNAWTFVLPSPSVSAVTPASATSLGGTTLTLTGQNFDTGATVTVGGNAATGVTIVSPTQMTFVTPSGADGPSAIVVTNPNGQTGTLAGGSGGFTYVAPPSISSVSPTSGPVAGGTKVTLAGAFFRAGVVVTIGGNPGTSLNRISANALTFNAPAGAAGPQPVVVTNTDGQSYTATAGYTYLTPVPPPAVTSVSPSFGPVLGGTTVSVVGSSFQVGANVLLGTNAATSVQVFSSTNLICTVPGGAAGTVALTVINPDGQTATLPSAYTYTPVQSLPALGLLSITPTSGSGAGGTTVTVSGRGIENGAALTIGGKAATNVTWYGPTAITGVTPAHANGVVDVTVTNPDGHTYTLVQSYTYNSGGQYVNAKMRLPLESEGDKYGGILLDYDNDGDTDVMVFTQAYQQLPFIYRNDLSKLVDATSTAYVTGFPGLPDYGFVDAVTGDFNGDGAVDVFLLSNCYRYLLQNTGGQFFLAWQSGYQCGATSAAVADLNGDGWLDVVVGTNGNQEIEYLNVGANTDGGAWVPGFNQTLFGPGISVNTTGVALGDVDSNGTIDLIVANASNEQPNLYLNDGHGNFLLTQETSNPQFPVVTSNATSVLMRDFNGDGCPDVILGNSGQQTRLFLNNGGSPCGGFFTDVTASHMPADTDQTVQMLAVDIDRNGTLDLVSVRSGATYPVRVYLNSGTGVFTDVTVANLPVPLGEDTYRLPAVRTSNPKLVSTAAEAITYDLSSDGYPDFIELNEAAQNRFLLNGGSGANAGAFTYNTLLGTLPEENDRSYVARALDFNLDGHLDIVKGTWIGLNPQNTCNTLTPGTGIKLLQNDGAGNLVDVTAGHLPVGFVSMPSDIAVVDVNNDGAPDIFITQSNNTPNNNSVNDNNVILLLNDGHGNFTDVSQQRLPSANRLVGQSYAITPLDYNRDGNMDVVVNSGGSIRLWENIGPGFFLDVTPGSGLENLISNCSNQCQFLPAIGLTTGDMHDPVGSDGGFPDIFFSQEVDCSGSPIGSHLFFNNAGTGTFTDVTSTHISSVPRSRSALLGDFNNDGLPDIFVISDSNGDQLYLGSVGAPGFFANVTQTHFPTEIGTSCTGAVVDTNLDGQSDIVLGKNSGCYADSFGPNVSGDQDRLYLNEGVGNFLEFTSTKMPFVNDNTTKLVVGDFNGDGKKDIYANNNGQSRMYFWSP